MKDTWIEDMLEVCDSTIRAWQNFKERLLARQAEKEKDEL